MIFPESLEYVYASFSFTVIFTVMLNEGMCGIEVFSHPVTLWFLLSSDAFFGLFLDLYLMQSYIGSKTLLDSEYI